MRWYLKVLVVVVFVATLLVVSWWRLNKGVHFGVVYVQLPQSSGAANARVYAYTDDGRFFELLPLKMPPRLWVLETARAVKSLVVTGLRPDEAKFCDVKMGASWLEAGSIPVEVMPDLSKELGDRESIHRVLQAERAVELRSLKNGRDSDWLGQDAINWEGDGWFCAVVLVQTVSYLWLLWTGLQMLQSFAVWGQLNIGEPAGNWRGLGGIMLQLPRLAFIALLVHQVGCAFRELSALRGPAQFIAGTLAFSLLALRYAAWIRYVERQTSRSGLVVRMILVGLLMMGLKVVWVSTVDYKASSDYAKYEKLGQWLAAGDHESLRSMKTDLIAPTYLARAWSYMYPVCLLFGPGRMALELTNCAVQGISVLLMCVLICRVMNLQTSARFLPLAFVYPEFWYSAGMVSHNIPGFFWIPVCWLLLEIFESSCRRIHTGGWRPLVFGTCVALSMGCLMGTAISFLNLSKTYGSPFLLGLLLAVAMRSIFLPPVNHARPLLLHWLTPGAFFLTTVIVYLLITSGVASHLQKISEFNRGSNWTLATVAGMDMTSEEPGKSANVWLVSFHEVCPPQFRRQLVFRRLLHEFLASKTHLYGSVLRKNQNMGRPVESMVHVGDTIAEGEVIHSSRFMRLPVFQKTIIWQFTIWLLLAGSTRLIMIGGAPLRIGEIFPSLSAGTTLALAYLFTDGVAYSGMNYAYPLCWTAALLADGHRRLSCPGCRPSLGDTIGSIRPRMLIPGTILCGLLVLAHIGLGSVVDRSGLTFHSIVQLPSAASDSSSSAVDSPGKVGEVFVSRLHAGVRLTQQERVLQSGDEIVGRFRISAARGPLRGLRFFVTNNCRFYLTGSHRSRQEALMRSWEGLPIEYVLQVQDRELERGPLQKLLQSRYAEITAKWWRQNSDEKILPADSVEFTLKLECKGDVDLRNCVWPPSLAVEFLH